MNYRFEVSYIPSAWANANSLMCKLDLGIEKFFCKDIFEIKTSHEEPKVESMKNCLKLSLEGIGIEVIEIKGGVWE